MKKNNAIKMLPQDMREALKTIGSNIQTARKRRRYTQEKLAELARTSRDTIRRLESGDPSVAWGIVAHVLWAIQLDEDLKNLADPDRDQHGLALAEQQLPQRVRSSEKERDKYEF